MKLFRVPVEPLQELSSPAFRIYCAMCALRDAGYPVTVSNVYHLLGHSSKKFVRSAFKHLDNLGWADYTPYLGAVPRDSKKEPGLRWDTGEWFKKSPPQHPSPGS